ncbi:dienelactone hydrolase family protein [Demequina sp. SO4-13]|uniref:dienelactone hydrolase family protein n=1 Tax=Demequina sp. SO4-13 TaxID=3401027 RepID=UPI003AF61338
MARESREIPLPVDGGVVVGDLAVPASARAVVVFAHGSGSSRHSARNRRVAEHLQEAGYATLLMDLLTDKEEREDLVTRQWRFDIALLGTRLVNAVDHLAQLGDTSGLPVAAFGASTGAAAALDAAAMRPARVRAVVSRGGRPDLATQDLSTVSSPTLLIVGGEDHVVIEFNEQAASHLRADHELVIVRGATHLFEEPGALDQVVQFSVDWLDRWIAPAG